MKRMVLLLTVAVMMAASALPAFGQEGGKCTGLENRAEGNIQALEGAIGSQNLEAIRQTIAASTVTLAEANEAGCTGDALSNLIQRYEQALDIVDRPPWPSE